MSVKLGQCSKVEQQDLVHNLLTMAMTNLLQLLVSNMVCMPVWLDWHKLILWLTLMHSDNGLHAMLMFLA